MESLKIKSEAVLQALKTLQESMEIAEQSKGTIYHQGQNDSVVQRFEYSIEELWKLLRSYLQVVCLIDVPSNRPRDVLRLTANANIITDNEIEKLLESLGDRNMTSHAYHERLAIAILTRIPAHYEVMKTIADRLHAQIING